MTHRTIPPQNGTGEPDKPNRSTFRTYARLLGYTRPYLFRLVISVLFAVVVAGSWAAMVVSIATVVNILFEPEQAKVEQQITEKLEDVSRLVALPAGTNERLVDATRSMRARPMQTLWILAGVLLGLMFVSGVARYIQEYFAGSIGAHVSVKLADDMYRNMMRQPLSFFERHPSGEFTTRLTNDIRMVNQGLSGVLMKLLREPFKAIGFLIIALTASFKLTLLGLLLLPLVGVVIVLVGKRVRHNAERSMRRLSSMQTLAKESLTGMPIVKGFGMEHYLIARMKEELRKFDRYLVRMIKADAVLGPLSDFLLAVGLIVFLLVGTGYVHGGTMSLGAFMGLLTSLALLLDPIRKLTNVNNQIQVSVASAQRLFEYIDLEPAIQETADAMDLPPMREALRFNDVHFSYDGKIEVLKGIDLEIRKGEMVALVGFSGAGKSTLVKLIPRFYDVTRGSVTIDGIDLRDVTFESLRGQIGIVTQDSVLFSETVASNIAFGRPDIPAERIHAAAEAAHAADFIRSLPDGYLSWVAEGGVSLSGGQRQRLSIARAIVKDPAILILDEATSNLDSESERAIQQAIDRFVEGRTTVVIAHRLSTVQRADRIVVLENGLVAEQGTHAELLAMDGIYRRLYKIQFAPPPDRVAP